MSYYTEPPVLYLETTTVVRTCSKQQPGQYQYFRAGAAVTVAFCTGMRWSSTSNSRSSILRPEQPKQPEQHLVTLHPG